MRRRNVFSVVRPLLAAATVLHSLPLAAWEFPSLPEAARTPPTPVPAAADPRGYPNAEGFRTRVGAVVRSLAEEDLGKWRRGYFTGGDPGKYLPGAAIARLMTDPQDAEARRYLNDDRSYKEHYHFAAVNWARLYPLYGETVLSEETRRKFKEAFRRYNYLQTGGTENHRTMWMTSANVLPHFVGEGTNNRSLEETLATAKRQLRAYVKGLYAAGPGEWDSPTYLIFTVNGLLNIYDFSPDPECRLLAQAGLDLLVAGYALKHTGGIFCGPNQRGHARRPHETIADQTGYLWWGPTAADADVRRDYRHALHAATSAWRPGPVLTAIARRHVQGLPVEQRNSKANYWYGQQREPRAGLAHETLWITPDLTMGSLWDAHASQHTRFMIAARTPGGAVAFTGGHPRQSDHNSRKTGLGFRDGTGRYVQSAQLLDTCLCMALVPEEDEADYAFFLYPPDCPPETLDGWTLFRPGAAVVAVRPLAGQAAAGNTPPDKNGASDPLLKFPGRRTGFFVVVGDAALPATLADRLPDTSRFLAEMTVSWRAADGRRATAAFNPDPDGDLHGNRACRFTLDGAAVDRATWPIFSGPLVKQTPGRLEVSDGSDGFVVDFSGDLPRYGEK
jgi:hypothetical protein